MSTPETRKGRRQERRGRVILASCLVFVAAMVGAAYAAVPFYTWFCQVTGFGGTTQRAEAAPGQILDRTIKVRFDANVASKLPWSFRPKQREIELQLGEVAQIEYEVANLSARETTGVANFNVTPPLAGGYFNKTACFCFTDQTLEAGESVDMPVVFFVDPALAERDDLDSVNTITLSYTFFERDGDAVAAASGAR